jgi:RNA polymerase sigma-70 factor, ECF subfamily
MPEEVREPDFERTIVPHLDAAYNLARWLVRNRQNAEDVVQEACLRAVRFFGGYQGGDARAWLLRIVRNTAYTFLAKNRPAELAEELNERLYVDPRPDAETLAIKSMESARLQEALERLPVRFREALILREMEGMSYKQIAEVIGIPMGTVMSSLARARARLKELLAEAPGETASRDKEVQRGLRR